MRNHYFDAYAQYFVKFLQGYAVDGVKISAVTVQNEVDTDQDGRMPQALWGQEYEMEFVKEHLGPALQKTSLDTKIWILDHNYNLWGRVVDELSDPDVYKYVDGVAWHGYFGSAIGHDARARYVPRKKRILDRGWSGHQSARLRYRLGKMVEHLSPASCATGPDVL